MRYYITLLVLCNCVSSQTLFDDFEGNGTVSQWVADDCVIDVDYPNPYIQGINPSNTVMRYQDTGGQYANVRFDIDEEFDLSEYSTFRLKIFLPSASLIGSQPQQVSLKLQNSNLGSPWITQSEVIKPLVLDQWQEIHFDFANDTYYNFDQSSGPPTLRADFSRVVIQINGENNNAQNTVFIDDFSYDGSVSFDPVFDSLIWSDEFNADGPLDPTKWHHQTIIPNGYSWFNGEVQHYTDRLDNSFVSNGFLNLVAKKEEYTSQNVTKQYTSARLNSKFAFTYGRVEVRAQMPAGGGTWPAIWMLGKNISELGAYWQTQGYGNTAWPACGEIDIMEHWGWNPNYVQSALHTPSSSGGTINHGGQMVSNVSSQFHVYELKWYPNKMVFSVDGVKHYTYEPEIQNANTWPFDMAQFILLNIAIEPSIASSFTESPMLVDYVRVFQESSLNTAAVAGTETIKVFPNPFQDKLQINLKGGVHKNHLVIYNTLGQLVHQSKLKPTNNNLDLSFLPKGLYYFKFVNSHNSQTLGVIKN